MRGRISIAEYLAGELDSPIKHEYLGGYVYAMAGPKNKHNAIATNILASLGSRLRGKSCRAYNSDTKVRAQLPTHTRFYYPHAMVVCEPNRDSDSYQDRPVVIVEVLSDATRRTDEGEKRDVYVNIPSLGAYLLVEGETPQVSVYRRGDQGFELERYNGLDAVIPLAEVEAELPLAEIYEDVKVG